MDIGAGISANLVTEPLTTPLEDTARACEIAGIVIGLATGAHPLVIACAHRLAHNEAGQLLSKGFEQVLTSIDADHEPNADPSPRFAEIPRFPKYLSQRWTRRPRRMTRKPRASGTGGQRASCHSLDLLNPQRPSLLDLADRECSEAAPSAYRRIRANTS